MPLPINAFAYSYADDLTPCKDLEDVIDPGSGDGPVCEAGEQCITYPGFGGTRVVLHHFHRECCHEICSFLVLPVVEVLSSVITRIQPYLQPSHCNQASSRKADHESVHNDMQEPMFQECTQFGQPCQLVNCKTAMQERRKP